MDTIQSYKHATDSSKPSNPKTLLALELESNPTSIAFLTIFSKCNQPFSLPHSIVLTTLTLPAAAVWLAIFYTLRPVPRASDVGFRGAVGLGRGLVDVELVVEGVVMQLVVGWRRWWWCTIVVLWYWWCTIVWRCMRPWMCTIQCWGSWMSCCCRGILWWDPYAT